MLALLVIALCLAAFVVLVLDVYRRDRAEAIQNQRLRDYAQHNLHVWDCEAERQFWIDYAHGEAMADERERSS